MKTDNFIANKGSLDKFKKIYGIRLWRIQGEKLLNNEEVVTPFQQEFLKIIENSLVPDQVYNADESGLFWRMLPEKTLVHTHAASALGRKISKKRIMFMPCNATGTHKLLLSVIGKP